MFLSDFGNSVAFFHVLQETSVLPLAEVAGWAAPWRAHLAAFSLLLCSKQMVNTWKIKRIFQLALKIVACILKLKDFQS